MAIRGAGRPSDTITARWVEKNPLGAALRLARSHRGLTQREMSEALRDLPVDLGGGEVLRASQATISKYEGAGGRQTVHKLLRGYSLVLGYHPTALKSLAGLLVVELESLREEQRSVAGEHWETFAERVLGRIDTWHALSLEGNPQALAVVEPAGGVVPLARAPEDETDAGSIGPTFDAIARPRALGHLVGPSREHALERRPAAGWLAGLPAPLRTPLRRGVVVALVLAVASIGVVAIPPLLTGKAAHLTHGKASPTVGPSVSAEASSSGAGGDLGGPTPTALQSGSNAGLGSDNHTGAKLGTRQTTVGSSISQARLGGPLATGSPYASVIPPLTVTKSPTANTPSAGPSSPVSSPSSGKHDLSVGDVTEFPNYDQGAVTLTQSTIVTAGDRTIWVAGHDQGQFLETWLFLRITSTGTWKSTTSTGASPPTTVRDAIQGPDGNIWFTAFNTDDTGYIGRETSAGGLTTFPLAQQPWGITAGPDGNLWFAASNSSVLPPQTSRSIWRITPLGALTEFPLATYVDPTKIVAGSDGNLWFLLGCDCGSNVGRLTPSGQFITFPVKTRELGNADLVEGSDGNIWFGAGGKNIARMTTAGVETEFPLPTGPYGQNMVVGPDGDIWFTSANAAAVGRISVNGTVTEFPFPANLQNAQPEAMTLGPDGNLWFVDGANNAVARITLQ